MTGNDADIFLIAAAPDLLAALETISTYAENRDYGDNPDIMFDSILWVAYRAIANARGESDD